MPGFIDSLNPFGNGLQSVVKPVMQILSYLHQQAVFNQQKEQASRINEGANYERNLMQNVFDPLRQNLLGLSNLSNMLAFGDGENPGMLLQLADRLGMQPAQLQSLYSSLGVNPEQGRFIDPLLGWAGGQQSIGEMLGGRAGNAASTSDILSQFYGSLLNGGMSGEGNNVGEELFRTRGSSAGTDYLGSQLQSIIGQGGANAHTTELMRFLMGAIGTGGATPELTNALQRASTLLSGSNPAVDMGLRQAQSILERNGQTEGGNQAQRLALDIMNGGGETANSRALSAAGMGRLDNPLISLQDGAGYLMSTVGSNAIKNSEEAMRLATMRGGGPGAVIAGGTQDLARRAASDKGLETYANALTQFINGQQQLGLENNKIGTQMLGAGSNAADTRFGSAASLFNTGQSNDINRFNTGANLLTSALGRSLEQTGLGFTGLNSTQGTQDNRLNQWIGNALNTNNSNNSLLMNALGLTDANNGRTTANLLAGNSLVNDNFQRQFAAANGLQQAGNFDLGLSQQGMGWQQLASGLLTQGLSGHNSSLANNRDTINSFFNALNQNTGNQLNLGNMFLGVGNNANNGLGNLVNGTNNSFTSLLQSLGSIFR